MSYICLCPGYTRILFLEAVHTTFELNYQMVVFPEFGAELSLYNCTPIIILNNPVYPGKKLFDKSPQ